VGGGPSVRADYSRAGRRQPNGCRNPSRPVRLFVLRGVAGKLAEHV